MAYTGCLVSLSHSYSSGGEDGYVRVHTFDQSYFKFKIIMHTTVATFHYVLLIIMTK